LKKNLQDLNDILGSHDDLDLSLDPAVREEYGDLKKQVAKITGRNG